MLFLRTQFPFGVQRLKRLGEILSGFGGFNDGVDKPAASGNVGLEKVSR